MIERIRQFIGGRSETEHAAIKNTAWLTTAELGSRAARGILAIIAARMLGATGLGLFTYAMALGGFLTFFEEAGISMFVTREFLKDSSPKKEVFGTALVLKLALLGAAIAFFMIVGPMISNVPAATALIPVMALILIFDSLRSFFFSVSRAQQKMHVETKNQLMTNGLVVLFGLAFLTVSPTALSLALGYAAGGAVGAVAMFLSVRQYLPNIFTSFSKDLCLKIFRAAWPFTILTISNLVIFNTDTLFIGHYATVAEVGWYGAASRVVQMLYILPSLFSAATFPILAQKAASHRGLRSAVKKSLLAMALVMVPLVVIMTFGSHLIVLVVFGRAYAPAALPLAILSLSYVPVFVRSVFNNAIFALDRQKQFILANVVGMVLNVVLDFALVPSMHGVGAAIAGVVSLCVISFITWFQVRKLTAEK